MMMSIQKAFAAQKQLIARRLAGAESSIIPDEAWPGLQTALRLSKREVQIVKYVLEDQKEESIAYELGISPHTVNTYLQRLYAKLNVASRVQLIVRVLREHILLLNDQPGGRAARLACRLCPLTSQVRS
jgi:DNA-binding CsgD family transcriptional regulator